MGTLILWYQMKDYVKSSNHLRVIFVTDDRKEDW
jgi:hypothetical protein